ncbi:SIR2 family protein [Morganella psychrotolerans]|uniref:SIR2 family protein n=1 Tax=Morganella psychrotolerans TaxID=368603 RepID=UPI0039AEAE48
MTNQPFDYDGLDSVSVSENAAGLTEIMSRLNKKRVCFFLGAGFSKAWNESYPLSNEIFSISNKESEKNKEKYGFFSLFESLNFVWGDESSNNEDKAKIFKNFKFTMDVYRRYPSLLPEHVDKQTVDIFEKQIKTYIKNKFVDEFIDNTEFQLDHDEFTKEQLDIINFFKKLIIASKLNVITTNYDITIDKVLHNASPSKNILRGFPVHFNGKMQCPKKGGIGLYKLNGGFEVVSQDGLFKIDYDSMNNDEVSPNIILPSNDQDYSDKYFKSMFIKSSNQLRNSDILVFVGYSFPQEDHIIQFLLKTFTDNDNHNKEVIIIDRDEENSHQCYKNAQGVFKDLHEKDGLYYFKGSFLDVVSAISTEPA